MKFSLLLTPFPLAALLLLPRGSDPTPLPAVHITGEESAEQRACASEATRLGHETVRIGWTSLGMIRRDVEAFYCVFHGDIDAPLAFTRDADRVIFSLVGRGEDARDEDVGFRITTATGRTITLGPVSVRIAPRNRRSCRVEICTAFTEPGERVAAVEVLTN